MKMLEEHYNKLEQAIREVQKNNTNITIETYAKRGLTAKRYRWDLLNAAIIEGKRSCHWLSDHLYGYLDDTHIDTALRKITSTY